jgi:hypothetical protein
MLSLFWVLLVVAQPTVNANRAMTLIMLNEVLICFIVVGSFQFCGCLEDGFIDKKEFVQGLSQLSWIFVYKTLVLWARGRAQKNALAAVVEVALPANDLR